MPDLPAQPYEYCCNNLIRVTEGKFPCPLHFGRWGGFWKIFVFFVFLDNGASVGFVESFGDEAENRVICGDFGLSTFLRVLTPCTVPPPCPFCHGAAAVLFLHLLAVVDSCCLCCWTLLCRLCLPFLYVQVRVLCSACLDSIPPPYYCDRYVIVVVSGLFLCRCCRCLFPSFACSLPPAAFAS